MVVVVVVVGGWPGNSAWAGRMSATSVCLSVVSLVGADSAHRRRKGGADHGGVGRGAKLGAQSTIVGLELARPR